VDPRLSDQPTASIGIPAAGSVSSGDALEPVTGLSPPLYAATGWSLSPKGRIDAAIR